MFLRTSFIVILLSFATPKPSFAQASIPLVVDQGFPLRVTLTEKLRYKLNEPVQAQLAEPVFSFDREVIPAGTQIEGRLSGFQRPAKWRRIAALLNGNLTPIREPQLTFDTLVLKDGQRISIATDAKPGADRLVQFGGPESAKKKGRVAAAKETAREQISGKKQEILIAVKAPGRMDRLKSMMWGFAPWHPQSVPAGAHFKASLRSPLELGSAVIPDETMNQIGSEMSPDSIASARLITDLSSESAKKGAAVEAILTRPLQTSGRQLAFPEGSILRGAVIQARPARRWHRSGKLAFTFSKIELPPAIAARSAEGQAIDGRLESVAVEGATAGNLKFDDEGGIAATQSKTRFVAPAVALLMTSRAADDGEHAHYMRSGEFDPADPRNNYGGRVVAGGLGFGLIGSALGRISRPFGVGLGIYGAARSIYSNVLSRGQEIKFPADTPIEIRFASR